MDTSQARQHLILLDMGDDLGMRQEELAKAGKDKHTPEEHTQQHSHPREGAQVPPAPQIPRGATGLDAGHGPTPDG